MMTMIMMMMTMMMAVVDCRTPKLVDNHHRGNFVCKLGTLAHEKIITYTVSKLLIIRTFCLGNFLTKGAD